ncbi:MAG: hypothetical protein U0401_16400 [Anaerolineae bacterium]
MMSSELTYPQVLDLLLNTLSGRLSRKRVLAVDAYLKNQQDLLSRLRQRVNYGAVGKRCPTRLCLLTPSKLMARVQMTSLGRGEAVACRHRNFAAQSCRADPHPHYKNNPAMANQPLSQSQVKKFLGGRYGHALLGLIFFVIYVFQLQSQLGQLSGNDVFHQKEISHLQLTNNQLQQ